MPFVVLHAHQTRFHGRPTPPHPETRLHPFLRKSCFWPSAASDPKTWKGFQNSLQESQLIPRYFGKEKHLPTHDQQLHESNNSKRDSWQEFTPGDSVRDLFFAWWKHDLFFKELRDLQRSGMKRSPLESPGSWCFDLIQFPLKDELIPTLPVVIHLEYFSTFCGLQDFSCLKSMHEVIGIKQPMLNKQLAVQKFKRFSHWFFRTSCLKTLIAAFFLKSVVLYLDLCNSLSSWTKCNGIFFENSPPQSNPWQTHVCITVPLVKFCKQRGGHT